MISLPHQPLSIGQNFSDSIESEIQAIRLVGRNGTILNNRGRVEILYDGVWGTICGDYWRYNEAKVACR